MGTDIDFSSLLRRYISLVQVCEGADFINCMDLHHFTQEEIDWMQQVGREEWGNLPFKRKG